MALKTVGERSMLQNTWFATYRRAGRRPGSPDLSKQLLPPPRNRDPEVDAVGDESPPFLPRLFHFLA